MKNRIEQAIEDVSNETLLKGRENINSRIIHTLRTNGELNSTIYD